ncbi:MAG: type III restriction-modification system endonuclease [Planctomycetaceae bacterium]|nr:type III restriction-modification system endonuclease [Planctomycetaceae bacterium]
MNDNQLAIQLVQLPHQSEAIDAVLSAMGDCRISSQPAEPSVENYAANPVIEAVENIDVKMETGTGKTYVYTRLMFALHQYFGLFKFIIVVPSRAIKEGTKNFIQSSYAKQHFQQFYPGKRLNLQLINAGDFSTKNGKRKMFPTSLVQYVEAARNEQNSINCLLLNTHLLDRDKSQIYLNDYDQTFFGGATCPAEAIKLTRPIVIIDEPHRIKPGDKAFENIRKQFNPQLIIRFGATFPEKKGGGKEYFRGSPVYELGAVEAFNSGLVKAIDIIYPDIPGVTDPANALKYKVKSINSGMKKSVVFQKVTRTGGTVEREKTLGLGDRLSVIDAVFEGDVTLDQIKSQSKAFLSNEIELGVGMELFAQTFTTAYQELILQQAIDVHFEKEIENFFRPQSGVNAPKIKTISLFFIDSIPSYRDADGWLKEKFEKLLTNKLDKLISQYKSKTSQREIEYCEYLQATRSNLADAHGGYFSKDWGEPDESAVAEEREDILHKERTLTFRKESGEWNVRRFFFSKWTLREGWDNPNVFVIAKMRTSGSDTSKLQEVGRGLRLPVDERGNRLSEEEFRLTYLIDYSERGFAQKLVGEINSDAPVKIDSDKVTDKTIRLILQSQNADIGVMDEKAFSEARNAVLERLDELGIIKRDNSFKKGGYEKLLVEYPRLVETLNKNKVTERSDKEKPARPKVKLRLKNWEKIKDFWNKVTKRYMLEFERLNDGDLETMLANILSDNGGKEIFVKPQVGSHTFGLQRGETKADNISITESVKLLDSSLGTLSYGEFLRQLHRQTSIPLALLAMKIAERLRELQEVSRNINELLNTTSVSNFVSAFQREFRETFAQKYQYRRLDFSAKTSVFSANGSPVTEFEQGVVGTNEAKDVKDDKRNLYEPPFRYDSDLEHDVLKLTPSDEVIVFGKLPRKSIKVPTYTGGTTTPDFVYAIKHKKDTDITLHLIVETKAQDLRGAEQIAIAAQKKLFENLLGVKWDLANYASDVEGMLQLLISTNGKNNATE